MYGIVADIYPMCEANVIDPALAVTKSNVHLGTVGITQPPSTRHIWAPAGFFYRYHEHERVLNCMECPWDVICAENNGKTSMI